MTSWVLQVKQELCPFYTDIIAQATIVSLQLLKTFAFVKRLCTGCEGVFVNVADNVVPDLNHLVTA